MFKLLNEILKELKEIKKELQDIRSILEPKKKVISFCFSPIEEMDLENIKSESIKKNRP